MFSSATAGQVSINASTTLTVGGVSLTRTTGDGISLDSANAGKTFVDAYIQISPPSATNEINKTHTLTATVKINDASGAGYVNAPDATTDTFTPTSSEGANALPATGSSTTTGGSCNFMFSSASAGPGSIHPNTPLTGGTGSPTPTPGARRS